METVFTQDIDGKTWKVTRNKDGLLIGWIGQRLDGAYEFCGFDPKNGFWTNQADSLDVAQGFFIQN